jgi:hypothetical protein
MQKAPPTGDAFELAHGLDYAGNYRFANPTDKNHS